MQKLSKKALIVLIGFLFFGFGPESQKDDSHIDCSSQACWGEYKGAEFINGSDVAHQFSNKMSATVGDQLKNLFKKGEYSKVDFDKIVMTTSGMGTGQVVYSLKIPFKAVDTRCEAYTSFDHVGGWKHAPALAARKRQLGKALMQNDSLDISDLKTTPEGLQEYWIQWKNPHTQAMCEE
tara:strand:- start:2008 stop:2544 length:537 start_codon:yes stop_codon:yes gene_type:complete